MQLFTFTELKEKLQNDYDLTDEVFVSQTELVGYINEAIDDAETAIHNLHHEDKYFLVPATFSWVAGTQDYALPSDIYGNKIRRIFYNNDDSNYAITRVKRLEDIAYLESGQPYQYLIINDSTNGVRARFYPTPDETSTNATIWYIRNMKRMTTSVALTNVCEIPECVNFVYQHVRTSLAKKTRRQDLIGMEASDRQQQYNMMLEALKDMTLEEDNTIPMDLSDYEATL